MVVREISGRKLLLIAFYMGFSASIIQVLLIREILTLCRGNELIIGIIYASWFLGIYAGAKIKPAHNRNGFEGRLHASIFMLPVSAAVSIYSLYFMQIVFPRTAGSFYSFSSELLISFIFTLPVSFSVGLFFPSLVSLISSEVKEESGGIVFSIDSLGFFAGGIVFPFLLVEHVNPSGIISLMLLLAVFTVFSSGSRKFLILAVIPLLLFVFSGKIEKGIIAYTWNRTHTGKLVQYSRTKSGTVAVESSGDIVNVYGDGIFIFSLPDSYESRGIFHLVQSLRQERKRILLSGSGPGSLLHNLLRSGIDTLYYLEPDPSLPGILLPYAGKFYNSKDYPAPVIPGVELKNFLKNSSEKFDMIISIPPQPQSIMMNRFYTREFYSLCRDHLAEKGIFVTALHGFSDYMSSEKKMFIASIYAAFTEVFPIYMKTSGETIYLIGAKSNDVLPVTPDMLVARYSKTGLSHLDRLEHEITDNFSPDELKMLFEKTQLQYFDDVIPPAAEKTGADSDLKPAAYWKNIVLSSFREQSVFYKIISSYIIIPLIIVIISIAAFADIQKRYDTVYMLNGILIYITGLISISTMLIMVLIYQNASGIVYHHISLINALYMLGLGAGSFVFNRRLVIGLPYIFILIGSVLSVIYYMTMHESMLLFWLIIPLFSFLCGAVFPLLFRYGSGDYYASASVIDALDHLGAIAGALLTVLFLVPAAGIRLTIILNIILLIPACAAGVILFRKHQQ